MSAYLKLDQDFINTTIRRYLPASWMAASVEIRKTSILLKIGVRRFGIGLQVSLGTRLADFSWGTGDNTLTLEVVKASFFDVKTALSVVKPYLPEFIQVKAPFLIIDLNAIPAVKEALSQEPIRFLSVVSIRQESGWVEVEVDWENSGS